MASTRVLFVSWQGGLGHVTRDLAIVRALRERAPDVDVTWLAHPLAARLLTDAGERLLPESAESVDYNAEGLVPSLKGFRLSLFRYIVATRRAWPRNAALYRRVVETHRFDLTIGDESYEIAEAIGEGGWTPPHRFVMIVDFFGVEAMTRNPLEHLVMYLQRRKQVTAIARAPESVLTRWFVGEPEDVADRRMGPGLPNRRDLARRHFHFLGHIARFDPAAYADQKAVRTRLGYRDAPLIVCATGGTSAGKELLELCGRAYPILRNSLPGLQMVAVCGELFGAAAPVLPDGVVLHHYLADIHEHFAASDFAIVVGGGTTTLELTVLRRPFIYFPLEGQFDQQIYVAERLARHRAGWKMRYYESTPESLAAAVLEHIGRPVEWPTVRGEGARVAADLACRYLGLPPRA